MRAQAAWGLFMTAPSQIGGMRVGGHVSNEAQRFIVCMCACQQPTRACVQALVRGCGTVPKLLVGLVNGGPLAVDWLKQETAKGSTAIGAVLELFELGQTAGTAVASVLLGETNPSGKSLRHP